MIYGTLELKESEVVKKYITNYYNLDSVISIFKICEELHNPNLNYGKFAIIKSQVGLS